MDPEVAAEALSPTIGIERIEILLLIAAVVSMLVRRLNLPYTVGLTFAGIGIALLSLDVDIPFTKEVIFSAFLPPLIFEAAFAMNWRELKGNIGVVTSLATVGVVLSIALTTAGLFYVVGWPLLSALILGVLISATDPVSVIATFKEAGVTGRLRLLVEAESLFNDGTVAVIFGLAVAAVGASAALTAVGVATTFLVTVFGGLACGALVGYGAVFLAGRTDDHLVEITFTSVAAYGSFLLAEHYHLSGVLATLTAGVIVGNVGSLGAITDRGHEAVESFWEYVGFVANSLIFLLIGIRLAKVNVGEVWLPALVTIIFVTLGRAGRGLRRFVIVDSHFAARVEAAQTHPVLGRLARRVGIGIGVGFARSVAAPPRNCGGFVCRGGVFGYRAGIDGDAAVALSGRNSRARCDQCRGRRKRVRLVFQRASGTKLPRLSDHVFLSLLRMRDASLNLMGCGAPITTPNSHSTSRVVTSTQPVAAISPRSTNSTTPRSLGASASG